MDRELVEQPTTNSEWAPVTSGVLQGSVLRPVLFIIYINDVDDESNNRINKFVDDTQIGNSLLIDEDRQSLQEDVHKISAWSYRWEMPFNLDKCQVLKAGTSWFLAQCSLLFTSTIWMLDSILALVNLQTTQRLVTQFSLTKTG